MIAPEPTKSTVKRLRAAGFTARNAKGSHEQFTCPHGTVKVTLATGHKSTSAGMVRMANQAIARCATECG
ncbi:hypothetical protein SAMN04488550_2572 [Gordonia malaquae]|uniref:Type II toxin-antitoxin system HicA family toxin n=1 Tax=Gordonia malaquae NBRC 108250 TaxID=1223542 RepID=M3VCC3_GORML|nr:type II toxin-antitoxin system HicA family toxin [Gordonia malaquae]GAC81763.1 hypothetical protein GM1_044_00110 [Gordonia malaquae NBRC 108250]SED47041.1 hypothetical protein SAMN04488550_2572 [Gordonia malaquae]